LSSHTIFWRVNWQSFLTNSVTFPTIGLVLETIILSSTLK
jgi:hypothetical protein